MAGFELSTYGRFWVSTEAMNADESKELRERYRWEVVGPNPL
jgi:hypothetical protein